MLLGALGVLSAEAPARAHGSARVDDAYLGRLAASVRERLDAIAAAHAPVVVPPVPVVVKWKPVKLGSLDLGAPLVALTAADLDGDGQGELYAVTPREVVAIGLRGNRVTELGRVAAVVDPAVPAPRDVVGTAVVEGKELVVGVSAWTRELRIAWSERALVATPGGSGFLVCPNERVALVSRRNYFAGPGGAPLYHARCRGDLVDSRGYPLRVRGQVSLDGKLVIEVQRCAAREGACQPAGTYEYANVGAVFEIADVDRDGTPEVIVSDNSAPGEPDFVKVISLGGDDRKGRYKKPFQGGVAGIATLDLDGNGVAEVVAAVRFAGATRVDLWRLD